MVDYWSEAGRIINHLIGGTTYEWGPVLVKDGRLWGPDGTFLQFPELCWRPDARMPNGDLLEPHYGYKSRKGWTKLYGGKLTENVIQWLARVNLAEDIRVLLAEGYKIVNLEHDAIIMLVKQDGSEQDKLRRVIEVMKRSPTWLPDIPLDAEGSLGETYG